MKIAELFVRLSADPGPLKRGLSDGERSMDRFGRTAQRVGLLVGAGLFAGMVRNSIQAQNAVAQLNAVVKSTGGAAGFATPQLQKMASELQRVSTFSDEAIMGAQGLLLTFTRIRGAELQGATKAVLDLATAMGTDLKSAAIQVGKALNDPKIGLTALRRVGVSFSDAQVAVINSLAETGRTAEAQRLILAELEVQFGGSAAAARNTLGGALKALSNAFGDTLEVSGNASSGVVGALNRITDALPGIRAKLDGFFTWWQTVAVQLSYIWQTSLLNIQEAWAKLLEKLSGAMQRSAFAGIRAAGAEMEASAHGMRDGIDQLRGAMENWRTEELAAIGATNQLTTALGGGGADSGLAGAIAMTDKQLKAATASASRFVDEIMRATGPVQAGIARAMENLTLSTVGVGGSLFGDPDKTAAGIAAGREARRAGQMSPERYLELLRGGSADNFAPPVEKLSKTMKAGLEGLKAATMQGLSMLTQALLLGGGGRASMIGGSLGGAFAGGAGAAMGGKMGAFMGPVGAVVGTMLGSAIGGLFDKPKKKTDEATLALERMRRELDKVSSSLSNIPAGFKVETYRDRFTTSALPGGPGIPEPTPVGPNGRGGAPHYTINGPITVTGVEDVSGMLREIEREVGRKVASGGITLGFAGA